MLPRSSNARGGFTLIELIVVLVIMAVLAAITMGVITQVALTQAQKSDEQLIMKLDSELQKHWKAVLDRANEDPVPDGILTWAGFDAERARVIMRFLYLRNEFPQAYIEALTPVKIPLDTRLVGTANTAITGYGLLTAAEAAGLSTQVGNGSRSIIGYSNTSRAPRNIPGMSIQS